MNKLKAFIIGSAVALGTIGLAHAQDASVTGAWKLSTGPADDPCVITLTANDQGDAGTATTTGDCNGTDIAHWKSVGTSLQLLSGNGSMVAWLKPHNGAFEGKRIADGRVVALNR